MLCLDLEAPYHKFKTALTVTDDTYTYESHESALKLCLNYNGNAYATKRQLFKYF